MQIPGFDPMTNTWLQGQVSALSADGGQSSFTSWRVNIWVSGSQAFQLKPCFWSHFSINSSLIKALYQLLLGSIWTVIVLELTFLKLTFAFWFFCIYILHTHVYSKWCFKNKHKCNNKGIFFRACKESLGRGGNIRFLLVNSIGCIWTKRKKIKARSFVYKWQNTHFIIYIFLPEGPEFWWFGWEFQVFSGPGISPAVPHPHIITSIC